VGFATAVGYDGGMTDTSASPRRRFQFRLRTLLIGVTLFCIVGGWFGNQVRIGANLKAVRDEIAIKHGYHVVFHNKLGASNLSCFLQALTGTSVVDRIEVASTSKLSEDEEALIRKTFPEARIEVQAQTGIPGTQPDGK
jgi:hypothetical protein